MSQANTDMAQNLLFGLLALQNGMISQDALLLAFHAWTQAKNRPMAEVMAAQGAISQPRRALLEALAAEHLAVHGGDPDKSLAAVQAGRSTRESLARIGDPEIEATLGHVGTAAGSTEDDADRTGTYAVGTTTSDGQRFRVLRPHARGGLGAVFVALDTELHREVALKQILDRHADDPVSRSRFLLEAEVTGGLEHPGIVPVYGLGTYGDGRPYYAMRFIRGDSLKEAIERFHGDEDVEETTPAAARWHCESFSADSSTSATRSTTRTAGGCCTATSSPATSSSASTARPWSSTGGWPSRWASPNRRGCRRADARALVGQRVVRDAAW